MNQCASKNPELPFAIKMRKLWANKFYLPGCLSEELIRGIESGEFSREEDAVAFIDTYGEWLP